MSNEPKVPEVRITAEGLREAISSALMMPIGRGPVTRITKEDLNLIDFGRCNTLVFERMVGRIAINATKGDLPSATWLMKYAGLEPASKQEITVDAPIIYNDVPLDETALPPAEGKPIDDVPLE